jgi:hypothetical protein
MNLDTFSNLVASFGHYGVNFDGFDFEHSMDLMGIQQPFSIDNGDVDALTGKLNLLKSQLSYMDICDNVSEETVSDAIWYGNRLSWWLREANKAKSQQFPEQLLEDVASLLDAIVHRLKLRQVILRTEALYKLSGRQIGIEACLGNGTIDNIKRCKTNASTSTLKRLSQFTGVSIGGYHVLPGNGSTAYAMRVNSTRAHVDSMVLKLNKISLEFVINHAMSLLDEQKSIVQPDSNILLKQRSDQI